MKTTKLVYEEVVIDVVMFGYEDVVRTSGLGGEDDTEEIGV